MDDIDRRSMDTRAQPGGSPDGSLYEVVASYDNYQAAQQAVDWLSDQNFDVRSLRIVAQDVSFVEDVTGRMTWLRALLGGLGSGALTGAFVGFIFGIFNFFAPLTSAFTLALYGLLFGAVLGAIVGLISYAFSGGRRDFTSVSRFRANRYEVTAHPNVAADARRLLADGGRQRT